MLPWIIRLLVAALSALGAANLLRRFRDSSSQANVIDAQHYITEPKLPQTLTRTRPDELTVHWQTAAEKTQVTLRPFGAADEADTLQAEVRGGQAVTLTGEPDVRYSAELCFDDGTCAETAERIVPLASVPNFRDIGGYLTHDGKTVRWGLIYRASSLAYLSDTDAQRLREMDLRTICDLRTAEEMQNDPDKVPDGMTYIALSPEADDNRLIQIFRLLADRHYIDKLLPDLYTRVMLDNNAHLFGTIMKRIAEDDNLPLLIHCAAGKDRTGIAVALLLSVLGVPRETIIADYTLSNASFDYFYQISQRVLHQLATFGIPQSRTRVLLLADAKVMEDTLFHIHSRYGSAANYLRKKANVEQATLDRIRERLLE